MSFVLLAGIVCILLGAFGVHFPVVAIEWLGVALCFAGTHTWNFVVRNPNP